MDKKKKCPQCKNLMLVTSPTCLYCGRPNKFVTKDYVSAKWSQKNNKTKSIFSGLLLKILIIFGIIFLIIKFT